jgi:hypothetical protein
MASTSGGAFESHPQSSAFFSGAFDGASGTDCCVARRAAWSRRTLEPGVDGCTPTASIAATAGNKKSLFIEPP